MQTINFKATGVSPILMHSDKFANPLDPMTKAHKELTSKRKKSDSDHEEIARSEWMGGLYYDDQIGVFIPGQNIDATFVGAAKLSKLGTLYKRAAFCLEDKIKLEYDGPKEPKNLFEDGRFIDMRGVKVGAAKIMRCRPRFEQWSIEFSIMLDEEQLNQNELIKIATDAGRMIGLGDFRPRFGKFLIEVQ